jgi:predicted RNA-binding Zn-ribbon protein involved in translation (DUF1610 family)
MPKCPECGKYIDYLVVWKKEVWTYTERYDYPGEFGDMIDSEVDVLQEEYSCPRCGSKLFESEEEAKEFFEEAFEEAISKRKQQTQEMIKEFREKLKNLIDVFTS